MPLPRKSLISLDTTPYYHCVSRCVRRAFLCGRDASTGQDYQHRRGWIEQRLLEMGEIFAIDICAYAVMSNHYHVVLHINCQQAQTWSPHEVALRWHRLFKGSLLTRRFLQGQPLDSAEYAVINDLVAVWRSRLMDISWFMRVVNEGIARRGNAEDQCTGRFWEGRFKSQALLDEQALAACMAYVDLNPIRATLAKTPETSAHTSIKTRIETRQAHTYSQAEQPPQLYPFIGNPRAAMPEGLPFRLNDYLQLVDWTGRQLRQNKRGYIDSRLPPILDRLRISPDHWCFLAAHFERQFKTLVGTTCSLRQACCSLLRKRCPSVSIAIA